jgi:erythromycin esterase
MKKKVIIALGASAIILANFVGSTYANPKTEVPVTAPYNTNQMAEWLEAHAKPLKTTNPTAPLNDLKQLKNMVGSASIVGLGEATHGAHEVFTMKHRIVNYLVSEKGFINLVLEEGWDRALVRETQANIYHLHLRRKKCYIYLVGFSNIMLSQNINLKCVSLGWIFNQ